MTPKQLRIAIAYLFIGGERDDDQGIGAFARWLRINPSTIHRWLSGATKVHPAVDKLLRLMVRHNLTPDDV
jgi:hypothetical protein